MGGLPFITRESAEKKFMGRKAYILPFVISGRKKGTLGENIGAIST